MIGRAYTPRSSSALGVVAGAIVGSTVGGAARAQEPAPLTLAWEAPSGCPRGAEIEGAVRSLLGGVRVAPENRVEARAIVTRSEAIYRVELATRRGEARGSRRFEAATCRELGEAVALTLALTLDPEKAGAPPPVSAPLPAPPPPPPLVAPGPAPAPAPAPRRPPTAFREEFDSPPRDVRPRSSAVFLPVGVGFVGDVGVTPTAHFGPAISIGVLRGRLRGDLSATYLPPGTGSQESAGGGRAGGPVQFTGTTNFSLVSGSIRGCYLLAATVVEVGPCAVGELGLLHGATNVSGSSTQSAAWAAAGLGAALGIPIYRGFAVWMPTLVEFGLARPTFTIKGTAAQAHQPAAVTGRAEIGVEHRF